MERVQKGEEITNVVDELVAAGRFARIAVATLGECEGVVGRREMGEVALPRAPGVGEPMEEYEYRPMWIALLDVVKLDPRRQGNTMLGQAGELGRW